MMGQVYVICLLIGRTEKGTTSLTWHSCQIRITHLAWPVGPGWGNWYGGILRAGTSQSWEGQHNTSHPEAQEGPPLQPTLLYSLGNFEGTRTNSLEKTPRPQIAKELRGKGWGEWREVAGRASGTAQN